MTDSRKKEFLKQVERLLNSQRVGVLATRYKNTPHQSLIAFQNSEDLREIFFVSPTYTRKVAAMEENPHVALLVDNRQNLESDFDACIAVTVKGTADELSEEQWQRVLPKYLNRNPYLKDFVASPSCKFFRIRVQSYSLVSTFQKVEELFLQ